MADADYLLDLPHSSTSPVRVVEVGDLEAEEEEDICISDICPICRSICSTLPPVAWRSCAAMATMTTEFHLLVTGTNIDVKWREPFAPDWTGVCVAAFRPNAQFMVIKGNIMSEWFSKYPVASLDNTRTGALAGTRAYRWVCLYGTLASGCCLQWQQWGS